MDQPKAEEPKIPVISTVAAGKLEKDFHRDLTARMNMLFRKYKIHPLNTVSVMSQILGQIIANSWVLENQRQEVIKLVVANIDMVFNAELRNRLQVHDITKPPENKNGADDRTKDAG